MMTTDAGRRALARRPVAPPPLRKARRGPSPALLCLAAATVAIVATPLVFLLLELAGEPEGAARNALLRPRTARLAGSTIGLVAAVILERSPWACPPDISLLAPLFAHGGSGTWPRLFPSPFRPTSPASPG